MYLKLIGTLRFRLQSQILEIQLARNRIASHPESFAKSLSGLSRSVGVRNVSGSSAP